MKRHLNSEVDYLWIQELELEFEVKKARAEFFKARTILETLEKKHKEVQTQRRNYLRLRFDK